MESGVDMREKKNNWHQHRRQRAMTADGSNQVWQKQLSFSFWGILFVVRPNWRAARWHSSYEQTWEGSQLDLDSCQCGPMWWRQGLSNLRVFCALFIQTARSLTHTQNPHIPLICLRITAAIKGMRKGDGGQREADEVRDLYWLWWLSKLETYFKYNQRLSNTEICISAWSDGDGSLQKKELEVELIQCGLTTLWKMSWDTRL